MKIHAVTPRFKQAVASNQASEAPKKQRFLEKFHSAAKNSADMTDTIVVPRTIFKGYLGIMTGTTLLTIGGLLAQKMKKTSDDEISLTLVKNPDILKELCTRKKACPPALLPSYPMIVGFCAESENLLGNAKEKISKKGCDYLIANDISRKDIGFSSDYNEVTILDKNGGTKKLERADKRTIARKIFEEIYG